MKLIAAVVSCALTLTICSDIQAVTWTVPGDAPTIQAGIDSAAAGDTVLVECNTYYEHDIVMKSGVCLRSETGEPDCVTIDAQYLGRVLYCVGLASTTIIEGFTITEGSIGDRGGGIYCDDHSSPTIRDCHITRNRCTDWNTYGPGMYCGDYSYPTVTGCVFSWNWSSSYGNANGGGMYMISHGAPTVTNCTFYGNQAHRGSAAYCWSTYENPHFDNCIMAFGQAEQPVYCSGPGTPILTCCDVYGNEGGDWVDCIAGQEGVNGNFSADPRFRDAPNGDFHLLWCSPCLDAPGCGLVGALGPATPTPFWHVPADAPTIQAGIDSAACGDTVVVACDTYYEHDIIMKSEITLRSETGRADCVTIDADSLGRVFYFEDVDGTATIKGFTITNGVADSLLVNGGGIYCLESSPTLSDLVLTGNSAVGRGGALFCEYSFPNLVNCTFFGNAADSGSGVYCQDTSSPVLANCIVASGSEGGGVECGSTGGATLVCCDIYGNAGGDWVGCIADQYGVVGNISEDPLFCDAAGGDFRLTPGSPCAPMTPPNPMCGLIGALGVGCGLWEGITSITDVPDDQGGQVRTSWSRHESDNPGSLEPITEYSLWRRIDQDRGGSGYKAEQAMLRGLSYPPGDWEYVLSVPALGESTYTTICPTLCDSTISQGMCWTVLYLVAHTEDPSVYYECAPDSGYSVDNLEPTAPQNLTAEYDGEAIVLNWDASPEEDFNYYAIYRGEEEDFPLGDPIGYSTEPTYSDTDLPAPGEYWYKVTATDFSGNESDPSEAASAITAGISEGQRLPTVFFLGPAIPNPFNPVTEISYGIPVGSTPSRVTINVYDATGREVRTLVDTEQGQGMYRVVWDGRDHKGSEVATGVYFYRIAWNGRSETRRMVLLK